MNDKITREVADTIVGTAAIECGMELNGNATKHTGVPFNRYMNMKAVDGKGNEAVVNAGSPLSPYAYKYIIRLDEKPVNWDQVKNLDPMLRATKGMYMIKYTPRGGRDYRKGRPFKIGQDLIRWDIRVSGVKSWKALCERVPELKWLSRNSTLTDRMFDLAVRHPGMAFWFTVRWEEYEAKLQAQSETEIEEAYVSRKVSVVDYNAIYKKKDKALLIRYFNDVLKEVNEVESLPAVQKEMTDNTGEEYDRSRKNLHDPVTGQFISKNKEKE